MINDDDQWFTMSDNDQWWWWMIENELQWWTMINDDQRLSTMINVQSRAAASAEYYRWKETTYGKLPNKTKKQTNKFNVKYIENMAYCCVPKTHYTIQCTVSLIPRATPALMVLSITPLNRLPLVQVSC